MARGPGFRWAAGVVAGLLAVLGGLVAVEVSRIGGDAVERADGAADAFYAPPAGAADGAPGTLVRAEPLDGVPLATRGWRLMYRSTDLDGNPVVVTGVLVVPLAPPAHGQRTVVSWGHPTTGTASACAPSRAFDPTIGIEGLRPLLDRGYAVVATDYAGMGTEGPDSYLIGATEGNNVLDAVRAAQQIPEASAGTDVILWGHSQGGQAVLFAAQQAAAYAPELTVRAVAAAAPAADLPALLSAHLDDISGVTIGSYAFSAYASVYGAGAGATLESILTPQAIAILPAMNALCLLDSVDELHAIAGPVVGSFTTADPATTEPWQGLFTRNSAGAVGFTAPLLLAQGAADALVIPGDTRAFADRERALGIDVTFTEIPGADHGTIAYLALPSLVSWLDAHGL
jgi:alpha-beta hydrolase superfamily lysophospholipase